MSSLPDSERIVERFMSRWTARQRDVAAHQLMKDDANSLNPAHMRHFAVGIDLTDDKSIDSAIDFIISAIRDITRPLATGTIVNARISRTTDYNFPAERMVFNCEIPMNPV